MPIRPVIAAKKSKGRGSAHKKVTVGQAHIKTSFKNTIVSITDPTGNVISWAAAGHIGFKGARHSAPFSARQATEKALLRAKEYGIKTIDVFIDGSPSTRESAIRSLESAGLEVGTVSDVTLLKGIDVTPLKGIPEPAGAYGVRSAVSAEAEPIRVAYGEVSRLEGAITKSAKRTARPKRHTPTISPPPVAFVLDEGTETRVLRVEDVGRDSVTGLWSAPGVVDRRIRFPRSMIAAADESLLRPGAIFYWSSGTQIAANGQPQKVNEIRFRRTVRPPDRMWAAARQLGRELIKGAGSQPITDKDLDNWDGDEEFCGEAPH